MKTFMKLMYSILFSSMVISILSSFFFSVEFFQWSFGISFLVLAISSVVISSIELGSDGFHNPYDNDEYYID